MAEAVGFLGYTDHSSSPKSVSCSRLRHSHRSSSCVQALAWLAVPDAIMCHVSLPPSAAARLLELDLSETGIPPFPVHAFCCVLHNAAHILAWVLRCHCDLYYEKVYDQHKFTYIKHISVLLFCCH